MLPEYDFDDWDSYGVSYGYLYKHLRPELNNLMDVMFARGDSVDKVYHALMDLIQDRTAHAQYKVMGRDALLVEDIVSYELDSCDHPRYIASFCIEHYVQPKTLNRRESTVSRRNRRFTEPEPFNLTGKYHEYHGPGPKLNTKSSSKRSVKAMKPGVRTMGGSNASSRRR